MLVFDGATRSIVDFIVRLNNDIVQGFPVPAINVVRTADVALEPQSESRSIYAPK